MLYLQRIVRFSKRPQDDIYSGVGLGLCNTKCLGAVAGGIISINIFGEIACWVGQLIGLGKSVMRYAIINYRFELFISRVP